MDADYKTLNSTSGVATDFNLKYNEWSYRSGLLYQPTDLSTYYLAWSDSFNPTADLYQLNNNIRYDAERSRTVELGTKWELFDGALSLRTALYRATKFNERNTDLEQANSAVLSKERHTDGFEIEAAGRITPQWDVFGGIALMRAEIDDQFDGELLGTFAQVSGGAYAAGQAANANRLVYRGKYNPYSVGATPRNTRTSPSICGQPIALCPTGVLASVSRARVRAWPMASVNVTAQRRTPTAVSGPITPALRSPKAVPPASCVPT